MSTATSARDFSLLPSFLPDNSGNAGLASPSLVQQQHQEQGQQSGEQAPPKKYRNPFISPLFKPGLRPNTSSGVQSRYSNDPDLPPRKRCRSGGETENKVMLNYLPGDKEERLACLQEFTKSFDISKGFGHVTATPGKPAVVGSQSPSEVQGAIRRLEDYDSESGHEAEEEEKRGVQGNASLMECD